MRARVPPSSRPPKHPQPAAIWSQSARRLGDTRPGVRPLDARPARLPHPPSQVRVPEQAGHRVAHLARAPAVHQEARLAVHERLARAARVPHHHRPGARGGLDEDVAPALDLQPTQPRPAGHREHVSHRVVAGKVLLRDLAAEEHRVRRRARRRVRAASPRTALPPTIISAAPGTRRCTSAMLLISMSWPLRATSRLTHTTSGRSPIPWRCRRSAVSRSGRKTVEVGARVEHAHRHPSRARPCAPSAR